MFTLLIVDDEKIERDGIRLLLRKFDISVEVQEADSGPAALKLMETHPPDILLTDIRMPRMDGLELARRAREVCPEIRIIIYSAYGEFDYARKAIQVKAEHYLLKPMKKEEFRRVFTEVLASCEAARQSEARQLEMAERLEEAREHVRESVLLDYLAGCDHAAERLQGAGLGRLSRGFRVYLADFRERVFDQWAEGEELPLTRTLPGGTEYLNLSERQSVWLVPCTSDLPSEERLEAMGQQLLQGLIRQSGKAPWVLHTGWVLSPRQLAREMALAEQLLDQRFYAEEQEALCSGTGAPSEGVPEATFEQLMAETGEVLLRGGPAEMQLALDSFFEQLKRQGHFSVIYVKYACAELLQKMFRRDNSNRLIRQEAVEQIFTADTLEALRRTLIHSVSPETPEGSPAMADSPRVIREVLALVHGHFSSDLRVEWLAEQVFLSPNYLNNLFRKETGQSLGKYITEYRLKKAADMLVQTRMKVADIGSRAGYENNSYFCSIFKSHYGVTPARYREKGGDRG